MYLKCFFKSSFVSADGCQGAWLCIKQFSICFLAFRCKNQSLVCPNTVVDKHASVPSEACTFGCLLCCPLLLLLQARDNIWPLYSNWTFVLISLSIPKILGLTPPPPQPLNKKEGVSIFRKLFSFFTLSSLPMTLSHSSSLQTSTRKGSGEGNGMAYSPTSGFNSLTIVLTSAELLWFIRL